MIFVNSIQIVDFQDVDSGTRRPELDISLQAGQINVTEYPLRAAVFANVKSLSLHFVWLFLCPQTLGLEIDPFLVQSVMQKVARNRVYTT